MKLAIHNPFFGQLVAETELARRFCIAAQNLRWQAAEVSTAPEINALMPDFVIALHNNSPKLTRFPTYGCMWNPPSFFEGTEAFVKNVLSYDAYLISAAAIDRWLHHLLYFTQKTYFTAPIYTSCPQTEYQPPQLETPQLVYLGSNWDGARFQELFAALDRQPYMQIYGSKTGWKDLQFAYRGTVEFDGISIFSILNRAGVGLCLHREEHRQTALPSMRIFEIVASGAVAICGDHPFIREHFQDSVLYIDPDSPPSLQVEQITAHIHWIAQNPQAAIDLSQQAHRIFLEHFTLEKLLLNLVSPHQTLLQQKSFVNRSQAATPQTVQYLVKVQSSGTDLQKTLESIAAQTQANVEAIVLHPKSIAIEAELNTIQNQLPITALATDTNRSAALWQGLAQLTADYFGILNSGDVLYPNHTHTLLTQLNNNSEAQLAYSGAIVPTTDTTQLSYFHPFDLDRLFSECYVASLSWIAQRSLLNFLPVDPQLEALETWFLLLGFAQHTPFAFSYELTCETSQLQANSEIERSRLPFLFWYRSFPQFKSFQLLNSTPRQEMQPQIAHLQQDIVVLKTELQEMQKLRSNLETAHQQFEQAQARIAAMETSKFWKLRTTWFKLKRRLGLPVQE